MAVCSAMAIKTCGSNSHLKKLIKEAEKAKKIPKEPKGGCAVEFSRIAPSISGSVDTVGTIRWASALRDLL